MKGNRINLNEDLVLKLKQYWMPVAGAAVIGLGVGILGTYFYMANSNKEETTQMSQSAINDIPEFSVFVNGSDSLYSASNWMLTFSKTNKYVVLGDMAVETSKLVNAIYENDCKFPPFKESMHRENIKSKPEYVRDFLEEARNRGFAYTGKSKVPDCLKKE